MGGDGRAHTDAKALTWRSEDNAEECILFFGYHSGHQARTTSIFATPLSPPWLPSRLSVIGSLTDPCAVQSGLQVSHLCLLNTRI